VLELWEASRIPYRNTPPLQLSILGYPENFWRSFKITLFAIKEHLMWYFAWILGVLLACAFGIINVMWMETEEMLGSEKDSYD
jgi:cytochrome bd-I ubiquinol oxidase subunit X